MIKIIALMKRADHLSTEEFADWAENKHPQLALELPGLRKYTVNICLAPDSPFDCVNELCFDSVEAKDEAFATDVGRRTGEDGTAHTSERVHLMVQEVEFRR